MVLSTEKQLNSHLQSGNLLPVYLLFGDDALRISRWTKKISDTAVTAFPDFNFFTVDGRTAFDMDKLVQSACNAPFLAQRRCCVVDDIDPESLVAPDAEKLFALLRAVPAETTLVLSVRTHPLQVKKKGSKGSQLYQLCDAAGAVCSFAAPSRGLAVETIQSLARDHQRTISPATAQLLAEYCGNDTVRFVSEIAKLSAYSDSEITERDLRLLVTPVTDARVFDLSDRLIKGNLADALRTIDELLFQQEQPVAILSILSMAFVDLYRAKAAQQASASEADARKSYGYSSAFRYTKAIQNQRRFSERQLGAILERLLAADAAMKSAGANDRVALEAAVADIVEIMQTEAVS